MSGEEEVLINIQEHEHTSIRLIRRLSKQYPMKELEIKVVCLAGKENQAIKKIRDITDELLSAPFTD